VTLEGELQLGIDCEDIMVLTGSIGCGKSLVLRSATHRFDSNRYQVIYLRGSIAAPSELFKLILVGMKIDPPHSITKTKPIFYAAVAEAKRTPVVVIDDAQDTATEALLILKAMTNFEADSSHRITFILAGQPELAAMPQYSHFDALRDRIRLAHTLEPMPLQETIGYIDHGLKIVDHTGSLFSDNAKAEIFRRTGGIARAINSLCYRAILAGAIEQKQVIDVEDIAKAAG
jgi:type II secretory pathway predicted ATPase ExeA